MRATLFALLLLWAATVLGCFRSEVDLEVPQTSPPTDADTQTQTQTADSESTETVSSETGTGSASLSDLAGRCVRAVDGASASASPDGMTWHTAFPTIQPAILSATLATLADEGSSCEVWIKAGTYDVYDGNPLTTIALASHVAVLGGFSGTETARDERDSKAHQVILRGSKQSLHVVSAIGPSALDPLKEVVIDGVTIRGGRARRIGGEKGTPHGGGMHIRHADVLVRDVTFEDNSAEFGGAIFVEQYADSPERDARFENCVFRRNVAQGAGGAVYAEYAGPTFINCLFTHNEGLIASASYARGSSVPAFTSCTFYNNSTDGGILGAEPSYDGRGGTAPYDIDYSRVYVGNCVFASDEPGFGLFSDEGYPTPYGLLMDDTTWSASNMESCQRCLHGNVQFVDPENGDFRLVAGSLGVDAALPASFVDDNGDPMTIAVPTDDLWGRPRDANPDIGALEHL